MNRTVIRLSSRGRSIYASLDRAPIAFQPDDTRVNLAKVTGTTMIERGKAMLDVISQRDPIRATLAAAFAQVPGTPPSPLYFHVRVTAADAVEWEQLYAPGSGFCALDDRWPIGRIAELETSMPDQIFTPPVRIVAVLSAAGRDGCPQLRALLDVAAASAVPVQLHVISGDQGVVDTATAAGVPAELIAPTADLLCAQIAAANPHILHLLCHGGALADVPCLAFASVVDVQSAQAGGQVDFGSIRVTTPVMVSALSRSDPWLIVLNACQTAGGSLTPTGRSLAHEVVRSGLRAVIGMRRMADLVNADRFCRALYPELLALMADAVSPDQNGQVSVRVIDWAPALTAPRRTLSGGDPTANDSWHDPVLYTQSDELRIVMAPQQSSAQDYAELQGQVDTIRGQLRQLDQATTSPDAMTEITDLLKTLEAKLAQVRA